MSTIAHLQQAAEQCRAADFVGQQSILSAITAPTPSLLPIPQTWRYDTYAHSFSDIATGDVLGVCTPAIWQLQPKVQRVTHQHHLPLIELSPKNLPVLTPLLTEMELGFLIVAAAYLPAILDYFNDAERHPSALVVITDQVSDLTTHPTTPFPILYELHAFPGVPLYYQDAACALRQDAVCLKRNPALMWSTTPVPRFTMPDDTRVVDITDPYHTTVEQTAHIKIIT